MDRISTIHIVEHWLYNHHLNVIAQMLRGGVRILFLPMFRRKCRLGEALYFLMMPWDVCFILM